MSCKNCSKLDRNKQYKFIMETIKKIDKDTLEVKETYTEENISTTTRDRIIKSRDEAQARVNKFNLWLAELDII